MDPMDRTPAHALTPSSCATQGTLVRVQLPLHTETSQFDQNTA